MKYIILLLITFGIIFIFLGLLNYLKILRKSNILYRSIELTNKKYIGYLIFIILLSFIFLYLFYISHIISLKTKYDNFIILITLLLFLGGIFVYIILLLLKTLSDSLENLHLEMVRSFVRFVTIKDEYTSRHSVHVADLVKVLWENLPLKLRKQTSKYDLIQAALLHDIGKIMIPLSILNKKTPLTLEEYEEIKKHTTNSNIILNNFSTFKKIIPWIKNHHERIDGKGYSGLGEHEIPLESKIISVADTYSALTTNRVYKSKMSHEEAIIILQEAAGTQLDKEIVDSFMKIKKETLEKIDFNLNFDFDGKNDF